jgi:hypothetical protein
MISRKITLLSTLVVFGFMSTTNIQAQCSSSSCAPSWLQAAVNPFLYNNSETTHWAASLSRGILWIFIAYCAAKEGLPAVTKFNDKLLSKSAKTKESKKFREDLLAKAAYTAVGIIAGDLIVNKLLASPIK